MRHSSRKWAGPARSGMAPSGWSVGWVCVVTAVGGLARRALLPTRTGLILEFAREPKVFNVQVHPELAPCLRIEVEPDQITPIRRGHLQCFLADGTVIKAGFG